MSITHQCKGRTENNKRCTKNATLLNLYCHQHIPKWLQFLLKIWKSLVYFRIIIIVLMGIGSFLIYQDELRSAIGPFLGSRKTESGIFEDSTKSKPIKGEPTLENKESSLVEKHNQKMNSISENLTENTTATLKQSVISGHVLDINGNIVPNAQIETESGEETFTNEFGAFELKISIRENQQKVFIYYKKAGLGNKEQYVGVKQRNIVLKL